MGEMGNRFGFKIIRLIALLVLPVMLSACLYLDIGTVLSLKKLDPYSVDLMSSRAAVLIPDDIYYAQNVEVTVRVTRGGEVLREEVFALEVVGDGEDLPGMNLQKLPGKPLVVRLAAADYERAIALQKSLGALDKNHQWVEPGSDTMTGDKKADRAIAADEKASGDLTIGWQFSIPPTSRDKYCRRHKKIGLTAWVKINDDPGYRRVVHGLPLKRIYGRKGKKKLCLTPDPKSSKSASR
jgi:hypothetical protein